MSKPLTDADKVREWTQQKLDKASDDYRSEIAKAEATLKAKQFLIPLGLTYVYGPGTFGTKDFYFCISPAVYSKGRLTDKELAELQKKLRKFPYSYRVDAGSVTVYKKAKK